MQTDAEAVTCDVIAKSKNVIEPHQANTCLHSPLSSRELSRRVNRPKQNHGLLRHPSLTMPTRLPLEQQQHRTAPQTMMMQTPQWQLLLKGKQHAKNATNTRGPNGGAVHVNTQPAQVVYAFCVSSAVGDDDDDDDDSIFVASPACGGERSPSPLAESPSSLSLYWCESRSHVLLLLIGYHFSLW